MATDLKVLQQHYQRTFGSPSGAAVLLNLIEVLFADSSEYDADPREHARRSGMRQVWLHINKFLNYTPDEVARMYRGLPIVKHNIEGPNGMA